MELNDIKKLSAALSREFKSENDPYRALASVIEEIGEVTSDMNRIFKSGAKVYQGKESNMKKLQEELGDLLLSVFYLANVLGIDLEKEMNEKYLRLRKKFNLEL